MTERLSEVWEAAGLHRSAEQVAGKSVYSEYTPTQQTMSRAMSVPYLVESTTRGGDLLNYIIAFLGWL